jgi:hypothetical protein
MRPSKTKIRLAKSGGEWNRIYAMAKRAGGRPHKGDFGFPTVVAERDGEIIGFVSTWPTDEAIVAGPLVIEGGRNPFLFLRLAEGYENVLRAAGVKCYLHHIDKENEKHVDFMERLGFTRWREVETGWLMKRELQ